MHPVAQFLTSAAALIAICAPTAVFAVWVVIHFRKASGVSLRNRCASALLKLALALGACAGIGLLSRSLERGSDSRLLVTLSMFVGYAYYLFVAVVVVSLVLVAIAWAISVAYERKA